ncbi:sigma-54-dependent transcriptional regulator [Paracoccaceae bacterium GXU_MW_L88]
MSDILVIDDEKDIRDLIADILQDEGHEVRLGWDADSYIEQMNAEAPDLIILDIWLKDSRMDGIDILKNCKQNNPDVPVVIISGHGNIEIAVAAIKQGAYDFIEKPFNIDQLMVVITRALETSGLRRENAKLRRGEVTRTEMIGESSSFKSLKSQLDKVTRGNGRIMLTGPSGAGKEIAARYIHTQSDRAEEPFVSVNSATISPERMEDVLFGTGGEKGLLEQAHGGILFLDEVADMPLMTQSKLLRVLVDQSFTRPGGSETVRVDARVISATTRDLKTEITEGRFREELYHRLNVVPIAVPSLEQRREDIPLLAEHFMEEIIKTQGLARKSLSEEAIVMLQSMNWPGNIRQLRNTLERALIMGGENGEISAEELAGDATGGEVETGLAPHFIGLPLREARELFERDYLIAQINRYGGNVSRTASFVGMERSALHRKLKSLGVASKKKDDS